MRRIAGVCINFCCEFVQESALNKDKSATSLSLPADEVGCDDVKDKADKQESEELRSDGAAPAKLSEKAPLESRQWIELWRFSC